MMRLSIPFCFAVLLTTSVFARAAVPVVDADSGHGIVDAMASCRSQAPSVNAAKPGAQPMPVDFAVGLTASSGDTKDRTQHVFVAAFDPAEWTGTLRKYQLVPGADGLPSPAAVPEWEAGRHLTESFGMPAKTGQSSFALRKIFTSSRHPHGGIDMVPFQWDALAPEQRAALDRSPATGKPDGRGRERVDYLRGQRDLENDRAAGVFRRRTSLLGDIVHSAPVFVGSFGGKVPVAGKLPQPMPKPRRHAVYVGANDGMLHGFAADNGEELFAYVPGIVLPFMAQLTAPDYRHRAFVDGGMSAADAYAQGKWRTVLTAALGAGAQALVALDVTDPERFDSAGGVLFEFSDADDADLGNVIGAPAIAQFRVSGTGAQAVYKFFVVVASGINNYRDDGPGRFNQDAASALFLLSLDKPAGEKWVLGKNYYKFRMPITVPSRPNGLAPPALVMDDNHAVRRAYAGDLQGNLWRFDFSGVAPWPKALGSGKPFFTAKDANGLPQPITTKPAVAFAVDSGYVVVVGTGKYLESSDQNSGAQSIYGVIDDESGTATALSRMHLVQRTLSPITPVSGGVVATGSLPGKAHGWFVDLPSSGTNAERVVSDPVFVADKVVFATLKTGAGPCSMAGVGQYVFNVLTGDHEGRHAIGAAPLPSQPLVVLDAVPVAQVVSKSASGRLAVRKRYGVAIAGGPSQAGSTSGAPVSISTVSTMEPAGRLAWRELPHWRELRKGRSQ